MKNSENDTEAQNALFASLAGPPVSDPLEAEITQAALCEVCCVSRQTVHKWTTERNLPKFGQGYRIRDVLLWLAAGRQKGGDMVAGLSANGVTGGGVDGEGLALDGNSLKSEKLQAEIEIKKQDAKLKALDLQIKQGEVVKVSTMIDQWALAGATLQKRLTAVGRANNCEEGIRQALEEVERIVRSTIESEGL